jgi:predicted DNA-binding transcriptional regulator YafY
MPRQTPDQLPRLLWLHRTLHDAPAHAIAAKTLEDQYDSWGLERKTKGRDLVELALWSEPGSDPLRYDRRTRTWSLTRPFDVPSDLQPRLALSDPTAQVLQLSQQILQATQGDGARAVNLLNDLIVGLPSHILHTTIFAPARLGVDNGEISATWNRLHEAISHRHRIELRYGPNRKWMRVDPLYLWWAQGGWYLMARQSNAEERRFNLALARMDEVAVATRKVRSDSKPDTYTLPKNFDPTAWLGHGDWLYRGGETRTAHIRFDDHAVASFRDRQWQPDARWEDHPDGTATLHLPYPAREDGEWEMARRILSWGEFCTVQKPASLAKRVKGLVASIAGRYER